MSAMLADLEMRKRATHLVSLPGFRWTPHMPVVSARSGHTGVVVELINDVGMYVCEAPEWYRCEYCDDADAPTRWRGELLPDLCSPALGSCLLSLAREAWRTHWAKRAPNARYTREPEVTIERVNGGWRWRLWSCDDDGTEWGGVGTCAVGEIVATEVEAIIAALEAAPT